jgi:hypothetical protein
LIAPWRKRREFAKAANGFARFIDLLDGQYARDEGQFQLQIAGD